MHVDVLVAPAAARGGEPRERELRMAAEGLELGEEPGRAGVAARSLDVGHRHSRREEHHRDATGERRLEPFQDVEGVQELVLEVDAARGGVDRREVLLEHALLAGLDWVRCGAGSRRGVAIAAGPHRAGNLDRGGTGGRGSDSREAERPGPLAIRPGPVGAVTLARLVPALHEVVVDVGGGGAA